MQIRHWCHLVTSLIGNNNLPHSGVGNSASTTPFDEPTIHIVIFYAHFICNINISLLKKITVLSLYVFLCFSSQIQLVCCSQSVDHRYLTICPSSESSVYQLYPIICMWFIILDMTVHVFSFGLEACIWRHYHKHNFVHFRSCIQSLAYRLNRTVFASFWAWLCSN